MKANIILIAWALFGIVPGLFAISLALEGYYFKSRAISLSGKVIGSIDGHEGTTNAPIVKFKLPDQSEREYRYSSFFGSSERLLPDSSVSILFNKKSGEARLDDFSELYLSAALIGFVSGLVVLPLVAGLIGFGLAWGGASPLRINNIPVQSVRIETTEDSEGHRGGGK